MKRRVLQFVTSIDVTNQSIIVWTSKTKSLPVSLYEREVSRKRGLGGILRRQVFSITDFLVTRRPQKDTPLETGPGRRWRESPPGLSLGFIHDAEVIISADMLLIQSRGIHSIRVAINLFGFRKRSRPSEIFFTTISAFFIAWLDNPSSPKTAMPRAASRRIS